MDETVLAARIPAIRPGRVPEEPRLVGYHREEAGGDILNGGMITEETLEKDRIYLLPKPDCSLRFAVRRIAACLKPDGTRFEPGANGIMRISVTNYAGLRRLLEERGWPEKITYEEAYVHCQEEAEGIVRKTLAEFSGRTEPWKHDELSECVLNSPELAKKIRSRLWLLFRDYGLTVSEPLQFTGIAQILTRVTEPEAAGTAATPGRIRPEADRPAPAAQPAEAQPEANRTASAAQPTEPERENGWEKTDQAAFPPEETADKADAPQPGEDAAAPDWTRVLLGRSVRGRDVYWEYGHRDLANRHLLITGRSGEGKTYAIQCFLMELAKQGVPSVIFDYTDGFLPEHLEPEFLNNMRGRISQRIALTDKIPVNPFKLQDMTIAGQTKKEDPVLAAGRFAAIMKHVYSFGEQQSSVVYSACREGMEIYGGGMNFRHLQELIVEKGTSNAKTAMSKMQQLFDLQLFDTEHALDWESITRPGGRITIIQLSKLDREIQTVITEILMWDAWYALVKCGQRNRPFAVVLDEAQNLSIADGSPSQKILQEGRKYGWSAWFATQFLKGALSTDEISRLYQAAEVLYFRPSPEEIEGTAKRLASPEIPAQQWSVRLDGLTKGSCVVKGASLRADGTLAPAEAETVRITAMPDRMQQETE